LPDRRFPSPWFVEEQPACFVVRDHNGQQLAYVNFEDEPGRRSAAKLLNKDEARPDRNELYQVARADEVATTLALTAHERKRAAILAARKSLEVRSRTTKRSHRWGLMSGSPKKR
jgi:hypothetical protein